MARFIGRELGLLRSQWSIEILSSFKPLKPEDEAVRDEAAQALALGAFIGAAQTSDQAAVQQFEDFYISTITTLPVALPNWSAG